MSVNLLVTPSHSFFDGAGLLAGLARLDHDGTIHLRVRRGEVFDPTRGALICLELARAHGDGRRVAIDLADRGDLISQRLLEWADVYFKRSYCAQFVDSLPSGHGAKIRPYGLTFSCLGAHAVPAHIRAAFTQLLNRLTGAARKRLDSAFREFLKTCYMACFLPSSTHWENRNLYRFNGKVILQTRVWPPEESADDLEKVNELRIALIRNLQAAFRSDFVGGIVADPYAAGRCPPEVLVTSNTKRSAYLRVMKSASIGVYTRGLHHAIAIKMTEYLATGLCIVSEPLSFQLPVPLVEGVNYLSFESHQECVERCQWLRAHPEEALHMRRANAEYYRRYVSPEIFVRQLLTRAFE